MQYTITFHPQTLEEATALIQASQAKATPTPQPQPAVNTAAPSLEQVRAVLTELSKNGKSVQVKTLLKEFGVDTLKNLSPEHFQTIISKAGAL